MTIPSYDNYLDKIKQPEKTMALIHSITYLSEHKMKLIELFEQSQSFQGSVVKLTLPR